MTTLSLRDLGFVGGLTAPAATLWTPAQITTALWLDAADSATITTASGAVSQWNDKSGNGRHASQATAGSRPTVATWSSGGVTSSAISFTTSQNLAGSISVTQFTTFMVCLRNPAANAVEYMYGMQNASNGTMVFEGQINDGKLWSGYARSGGSWDTLGADSPARTFAGTFLAGMSIGATLTPYFNGEALNAKGSLFPLPTSFYSLPSGLSCLIPEFIVLPSAASTATIDNVYGYLAWKWGLASLLPAAHPYKSAAPTV